MSGIFDFNRDGQTSFEEQLFGTMLVMGAFDAQAENGEPDGFDADFEEDFIEDFDGDWDAEAFDGDLDADNF